MPGSSTAPLLEAAALAAGGAGTGEAEDAAEEGRETGLGAATSCLGAAKELNSSASASLAVGVPTGDRPPSACASLAASFSSCLRYSCAAREVYCREDRMGAVSLLGQRIALRSLVRSG